MVDIARGMGMKTIAEFVEDAETVETLREMGVDYSQGYFHGRPAPILAVLDAV
jgi:EAL domain-containing protein (putative c-di-GMP-specific phosphodiesterase class I)